MTSAEARMAAIRLVAKWQGECELVPNFAQPDGLAKSMRDTASLQLAIEKALLKATRPAPEEFHGGGRGWDRDIS